MTYPKVLIYGISFVQGGAGVTLKNLFWGWPKDKLAICSEETIYKNMAICKNYYGSTILAKPTYIEKLLHYFPSHRIIYKLLIHIVSINRYFKKDKLELDGKFRNFLRIYNPNLLYAIVYDSKQISILLSIHKQFGIPLVIHIVDDWISSKPKFYNRYMKYFERQLLKQLIDSSNLLLSISDAMSEEYYTRYKRKFYPIMNAIIFSDWRDKIKDNWSLSEPIKIMYSGTVEAYNFEELVTLCNATKDMDVTIYIYGRFRKEEYRKILEEQPNCQIQGYVSHSEIINLYKQFDLLFLPFSFKEKYKKNLLLSMPTKLPEYMVSKTPIMVYAPSYFPVSKYAIEAGWGYLVNHQGLNEIKKGLESLLSSYDLRKKLGENAYSVAYKNHNQLVNQERLVNLMNNL